MMLVYWTHSMQLSTTGGAESLPGSLQLRPGRHGDVHGQTEGKLHVKSKKMTKVIYFRNKTLG